MLVKLTSRCEVATVAAAQQGKTSAWRGTPMRLRTPVLDAVRYVIVRLRTPVLDAVRYVIERTAHCSDPDCPSLLERLKGLARLLGSS
jgi:hypothetical protein